MRLRRWKNFGGKAVCGFALVWRFTEFHHFPDASVPILD
jgi:hypothetical protein